MHLLFTAVHSLTIKGNSLALKMWSLVFLKAYGCLWLFTWTFRILRMATANHSSLVGLPQSNILEIIGMQMNEISLIPASSDPAITHLAQITSQDQQPSSTTTKEISFTVVAYFPVKNQLNQSGEAKVHKCSTLVAYSPHALHRIPSAWNFPLSSPHISYASTKTRVALSSSLWAIPLLQIVV